MRRPLELRVARTAALLILGALAVHQLRYLLAFGPESGAALHREGHAYLAEAIPVLLALALAAIAARLVAGATATRPGSARPRLGGRALVYALALICVFWAQELAEGALSPGHPAGLAAIVASGAWIAVPLAVVFGLGAAALERLLDRAEVAVGLALVAARPPARAAPASAAAPSPRRSPLPALCLGFGFARRPPPLPAV